MIKEETFLEFQKAIKEEYGTELTFEQGTEILTNWVRYYDQLAKIYHKMPEGKAEAEKRKKRKEAKIS